MTFQHQIRQKMERSAASAMSYQGEKIYSDHRRHDRSDCEEQLSLHQNSYDGTENDQPMYSNASSRRKPGFVATPARREDWDDAATAVTGATSEFAYSIYDDDQEPTANFRCARYAGPIVTGVISSVAGLSPVVMVILPKVGLWQVDDCNSGCQTILFGLGFRLLLLLIATCTLFLRSPRSTMPRIFVFRAVIVFLLFVLTFTFWLFYIVHVYMVIPLVEMSYEQVATFAMSFADVLIFVNYLAVILIELRQLDTLYAVKVTRSPDGESHSYSVGRLSIQRLAVWCLEQYYKDFPIYNPYLDSLPHRAPPRSVNFKLYNVDGVQAGGVKGEAEPGDEAEAGARHHELRTSERVFEEQEYERRVARRRSRLVTAAEDAFTLIRRMNRDERAGSVSTMDGEKAAQAIFPSLERPLRKFLRVTRQQPWHSRDSVIEHLAHCIQHDMSARAFLEPYLRQCAIVWSERDYSPTQTWTIICSHVVSRAAEHGTTFQLCQGDIVLSVVIRQQPHILLRASSVDENAFVLRFNSETSV